MSKRPYLRAKDRHRQLLDAAGSLFDRFGFGGITMAGTATEAGVSRQLVYDHFADLDALYEAFVADRLAVYRAGLPDVAGMEQDEATEALFAHLVTIPPKDRRVVRLLVADVGLTALERVRERFRDEELSRSAKHARSPRRTRRSSAVLWANTSALLALADAVTDGQLTAIEAARMAVGIVRATSSLQRSVA